MFLFCFLVAWFGVSGKKEDCKLYKKINWRKHKLEKMTENSPTVALRRCAKN